MNAGTGRDGQLPLALAAEPPPGFDNFVAGRNDELVERLTSLAAGDRRQRALYLWGVPGAGKSHLLHALRAATVDSDTRLLDPVSPIADYLPPAPGRPLLLLVDDCDRLDADRQQALFGLLNRVRERPDCASVVAGAGAPRTLALRGDLTSRLAWGLVFEVAPLSDEDKARALAGQADARGVRLAADVVPWLLAHTSRDMRALSALLAALDTHALARHRPAITLPLVRELLGGEPARRFGPGAPGG